MNPREKNIARVKALLEKNVENGATEAEAMSALAKASELMKQWYISENDIKDRLSGGEVYTETVSVNSIRL